MKTKIEIIDETVAWYSEDVSRRALSAHGGCAYLTDNGRMCAVGRCEINPPKYGEGALSKNKSFPDGDTWAGNRSHIEFKPEYVGHDLYFWNSLQKLHDDNDHWREKGLSELGEAYVKILKKVYANNS